MHAANVDPERKYQFSDEQVKKWKDFGHTELSYTPILETTELQTQL